PRTLLQLVTFLAAPTLGIAAIPASDWVSTRIADVRLVSAASGTDNVDTVPLGLHFKLAPGWKIYWRTPGDTGFPPDLQIKSATNLEKLDWKWPVPSRFTHFGQQSFGYEGEVLFPITARLIQAGKPLGIDATVHALACSDICVPIDVSLNLTLPAGPAGPTVFTQLVSRYRSLVPGPFKGTGLELTVVRVAVVASGPMIEVAIRSDEPLRGPDVFVEAEMNSGFTFGTPKVRLAADKREAVFMLPATVPKDGVLNGLNVGVTIVDGARFAEVQTKVGALGTKTNTWAAVVEPTAPTNVLTWLTMLALGTLGGLILNLMPCVLPVLSLKLLSVLRYGGSEAQKIRWGFLASAAGIITSFLVLAVGTILLKHAGLAVGWGIQFQQPVFLAAMAVLVTGFAANLFGWLEIAPPTFLSSIGNPRGQTGGHFLTGVFATLLATPCSAPFLGTALGFALSRGSVEIVSIFVAMGVGLALPYLLVAVYPGFVRALPRPGIWMQRLRIFLGCALLATTFWLLSIISALTSILWLSAMALLLATAAAILAFSRNRDRRRKSIAAAGFFAFLVLAIGANHQDPGIGSTKFARSVPTSTRAEAVKWEDFDLKKLKILVAEGNIVLVDVTADWCLTCKVNKIMVLDSVQIVNRITYHGVKTMRADWTRPNATIAAYLASFRRYGVPFNVVYGPSAHDGIPLPELLSKSGILKAFDQAAER
ncbi:MAG: hypothetical protein CMM47_05075, partial [Rhodospirillaceae bacterium]|nr:hypothetical protein [Rhodospirillaceae bacterium]